MRTLVSTLLSFALLGGGYFLGSLGASKSISVAPAKWAEGSDTAIAWQGFSESLESAAARIYNVTNDERERREGLSYLAQLAAAAIEMKYSKGDREAPIFTDWMADYRKFLGDSPDAIYHSAEISPEYNYEVSGNIGEAEYIGFMIYGTHLNGWNRASNNLSKDKISFDKEGRFRIIVSANKPRDPSVNWLKLDSDSHLLMVRQYYHDREEKKAANFTIRNMQNPLAIDRGEEDVANKIRAATRFFNDTVDGAIALSEVLSSSVNSIDPPKSYSPDFGGIFYPTHDNDYYGSWFYLEEDEALIVEGDIPDAPYWSVSLQNRWMQSLDYTSFTVSLNDKNIEVRDGRYRVIISHSEPKDANWLSTTGLKQGLLSIRYQLSSHSTKPSLKLVKLDEI